jgi:hypothetical protein
MSYNKYAGDGAEIVDPRGNRIVVDERNAGEDFPSMADMMTGCGITPACAGRTVPRVP